MNDDALDELAERCVGRVVGQAALAGYTTLRVGGAARILVTAEGDGDLAAVSGICRRDGLPWTVIGRGSNLLVADTGWPGVAILLGRGFRGWSADGPLIRVGAAEPLPSLAVHLADAGYRGFAWACSVPGTIGGAVRMNAGAHGADMASHLVEAEVFRLSTATRELWPATTLGLAYRSSELPGDAVVVGATLRLPPGDPAQVRAEIDRIRTWRRTHQPLNQPNCGSVFTNPPGDSAGRLIDAAGCKGMQVGGAEVSERHANFIVTRPGATATDVATLIARVVAAVEDHAAITLHPEVRRLGPVAPDPDLPTTWAGAGPGTVAP
ncbi:MAG: UDP-N-acetylmuramate dehydrogenase [Nitriliruptoraceae bacterium]